MFLSDPTIKFLLAGILPAVLLVAAREASYKKLEQAEGQSAWLVFLSLGLALLLGCLMLLNRFGQGISLLVLILLPATCALFAELLLSGTRILGAVLHKRTLPSMGWSAGLLLLVIAMFLALARWGDRSTLLTIIIGSLLLAAGWCIWLKRSVWFGLSYLTLLGLMLAAVWVTDTQFVFRLPSTSFILAVTMLSWMAPGLGIVLAFRLLGWTIESGSGWSLRRSVLALLLILPILLLLAWQAEISNAWDVATDGLSGMLLLMLAAIFGIAAAIHQSWMYPARKYVLFFGFAVLILAVTGSGNRFGTYGVEGTGGTVPHAKTEWRAGWIDHAIQSYHTEQGRYPEALDDLTPRYLLYLPTPFIIPAQDWCYQGGADYYRLGFVDRDFFSAPAFVHLFASSGSPPAFSWECDAEAAKYPGPPGYARP